MSSQAESDNSNRFRITLEVIPDDPHDADPALVDAVGRDTADALRNDVYTIEPVYTGTRGGDFPVYVFATFRVPNATLLSPATSFISSVTPPVNIAFHE